MLVISSSCLMSCASHFQFRKHPALDITITSRKLTLKSTKFQSQPQMDQWFFFFYWSIQSISLCSWILSRFNPDLGNLHIERCRRIPCKHQPTGVLNTTHLISTHAHMEVSEVKGDPYFSSIFEKVGLSTIHHTAIGVALWRKPPVFLTFLWVYCHV